MTILRADRVDHPRSPFVTPSSLNEDMQIVECHPEPAMVDFHELAAVVGKFEAAAQSLIEGLDSIVASAITEAFGEIEDRGLARRAVLRAVERHGCRTELRISVHPSRVDESRDSLRHAGHADAADHIFGDALLGQDEVVLENVYGRLPLSASHLARRINDGLAR